MIIIFFFHFFKWITNTRLFFFLLLLYRQRRRRGGTVVWASKFFLSISFATARGFIITTAAQRQLVATHAARNDTPLCYIHERIVVLCTILNHLKRYDYVETTTGREYRFLCTYVTRPHHPPINFGPRGTISVAQLGRCQRVSSTSEFKISTSRFFRLKNITL